jgi:hypothetical protein
MNLSKDLTPIADTNNKKSPFWKRAFLARIISGSVPGSPAHLLRDAGFSGGFEELQAAAHVEENEAALPTTKAARRAREIAAAELLRREAEEQAALDRESVRSSVLAYVENQHRIAADLRMRIAAAPRDLPLIERDIVGLLAHESTPSAEAVAAMNLGVRNLIEISTWVRLREMALAAVEKNIAEATNQLRDLEKT